MTHFLYKTRLAFIILPLLLHSTQSKAQKIDTVGTFSMSAYIDAYYATYGEDTKPGEFVQFPTVSPKNNAPSLNTAQLTMQYNADKVRAMMALHFGDIAAATWAGAPYEHLMEAHVGFKITKKLWIDGGFFRTHFGTEYLLPVENITSSVSVNTYYEPYYESGLRLNYDPTKKMEINLFLLNGYGSFNDNNGKKSAGMGITYAVNDYCGLGYTNYIGDDETSGLPQLRIHQNVFVNYQRKKWKLQVGGDYCMQQNSDLATHSKYAGMYSGVATLRYQCTTKFAVYARAELFSDPDGYMSRVITDKAGRQTGFKLTGYTGGVEFKPTPESYIRLEGRELVMQQDQQIFFTNGKGSNLRYELMINGGVSFDLLKSFITKAN